MSMQFDLDATAQGDWFKFFNSHFDAVKGVIVYEEPEEDAERVCIRSMTPLLHEINEKVVYEKDFVLNTQSRKMERVVSEKTKTPKEIKAENERIWDYCITAWELKNPKGEDIPCTKENKIKAMYNIQPFSRFFNRCLELLDNASVKSKAEAEGN